MDEADAGTARYTTRTIFTTAPDGPSPLRSSRSTTCVFCGSHDTVWQHDLNSSMARWRGQFGYGMTWSNSMALCDDCEKLWTKSEYWQLVQRQLVSAEKGFEKPVEDRLLAIAAFGRADRGPRKMS